MVRDHGPVVIEGDGYLQQISSFNDEFAGCCENVQAAPYAPGEEGEKMLYVMADKTNIEGSTAVLNRRGDLLQAIIHTVDPLTMEEPPMDEPPMDEPPMKDPGDTSDGMALGTSSGGSLLLLTAIVMIML